MNDNSATSKRQTLTAEQWCEIMARRSRRMTQAQRHTYISKTSGRDGVAVEDRFAAAFVEDGNGCWMWRRSVGTSKRPTMTVARRPLTSARWAWEEAHGCAIPDGAALVSTCWSGPLCVHPLHHVPMALAEACGRRNGTDAASTPGGGS